MFLVLEAPTQAQEQQQQEQGCGCADSDIFHLFQIQVQHPAAKSMIEISRTQDEEVGDGTTSVIILGGLGVYYEVMYIVL